MLYRRIGDSLRSDRANRDRFCLDLSGGRCPYPKVAFKKLVAPFRTPMFYLNDCTEDWSFGISAKAKDLKIYGYLRVCVEVRMRKDGVDPHSTVPEPDAVYNLDIPGGSYDWQDLRYEMVMDPAQVANVCYYAEGEDYEGEILLESPFFMSANHHNLVGQFLPHAEDRPTLNWMGQNLSRIEWVGLRVEINGTCVFDGEIFERCHRFSESEISLPAGIIRAGKNTVTFTCTSDYRDAAGYILGEWGLITEVDSPIISVPESVTVGEPFAVCIEGHKGERVFVADTYDTHSVSVCEDVEWDGVLLYTDAHRPLVVFKNLGEGRVYFVNAKEYAGTPGVESAYRETIRILTEESLAREPIYAKGDRNIQFSVFEREDGGREIYFLATDWHRPNPDGVGKLVIGEDEYELPVPWGSLVKAVAFGDGALYPEKDENEVISLDGTRARVQGVGLAAFVWCHDGKTHRIEVDFTAQSVRDIRLEPES